MKIYSTLLLALSLLVGACAQPTPEPTDMPAMDMGEMASLGIVETDALTVELRGVSPFPVGEETTLEFIITDADGNPVEGADVALDLQMMSMDMPANRPGAQEVGDGVYHAQASFGMEGMWLFAVTVTVDGQEHAVAFPDLMSGSGEMDHDMDAMDEEG